MDTQLVDVWNFRGAEWSGGKLLHLAGEQNADRITLATIERDARFSHELNMENVRWQCALIGSYTLRAQGNLIVRRGAEPITPNPHYWEFAPGDIAFFYGGVPVECQPTADYVYVLNAIASEGCKTFIKSLSIGETVALSALEAPQVHAFVGIGADTTFSVWSGGKEVLHETVGMTMRALVVKLEKGEEAFLYTDGAKGYRVAHAMLMS